MYGWKEGLSLVINPWEYLVTSQNAEWFNDLLGGIVVGGLTSHELNKWTESDLTSAGWINNSQNALELGFALLRILAKFQK